MNSSDEFRDQQLRAAFKKVFDELKRQPAPTAKAKIFAQIPRRTPPYRRYAWLGVVMLLLISMATYWALERDRVASIPLTGSLSTGGRPPKPVSVDRRLRPERVAQANRAEWVATGHPATSSTSSRTGRQAPATDHLASRQEQGRFNSDKPLAGQQTVLTSVLKRNQPNRYHRRSVAQAQPVTRYARPVTHYADLATPTLPMPHVIEQPMSVWSLRQSRPLVLPSSLREAISRPVDLALPPSLAVAPAARPGKAVRWLVGVTPLSTYQWTTIVARPQTYVQQVDAPAAFAGSTWGYQLSGGFQWRQTIIQLSVGSIRRWAYYEVATNAFRVKSVGLAHYETTPLSQSVAENISLMMLGGSARQHWKIGGSHSPYFVRLGGALSYVPQTQQSLAWANASVGLSLPLTKAYSIQLGPTVEYGVSRLWSEQRQLIIHPYLVGATLSIQTANP